MSDDIKPTDAETKAIILAAFNAAKKAANVIYYDAFDKLDLSAEITCASTHAAICNYIKAIGNAREAALDAAQADFNAAINPLLKKEGK